MRKILTIFGCFLLCVAAALAIGLREGYAQETTGAAPTTTEEVAVEPGVEIELESTKSGESYKLVKRGDHWLLPPIGGGQVASSEQSWGEFILAAVIGGLIALLMPCVFPMIPITISFFSKQAQRKTQAPPSSGAPSTDPEAYRG